MNHKKQLLSLLSILSLVGSSDCLQASYQKYLPSMFKSKPTTQPAPKSPAKTKSTHQKTPNVIDLPDVMEAHDPYSPQQLLNIHGQAMMKQAQQKSLYSSLFGSNKKVAPSVVNNDGSSSNFSSMLESQGEKVTPAALLKSVLEREYVKNYKDAFTQLDMMIGNNSDYANQKQLVQQARTLLVRAHPELVPGLQQKLGYLPNRFMSYFKEKMPTLSTAAGKQRFTQSVMMETLKDIPDFDSSTFDTELTKIADKYASDLNPTNTQMVAQWSRNLVSDIALLAHKTGKAAAMTTGAAVGAGIGAAVGSVSGAGNGLAIGGIIGSYAGSGTELDDGLIAGFNELENHSGYSGGVAGGIIGAIPGIPARLIGLGGTAGGIAGAGAGAGLGAVTGGLSLAGKGGVAGAQAGARTFDSASKSISSRVQSAYNKLFTPKSNLTTANSRNSSGNLSSSEHTGSGASSDIFSLTSDGNTGTEYSNRVTSASPVGNSLPSFGQSNLTAVNLQNRQRNFLNSEYPDPEALSDVSSLTDDSVWEKDFNSISRTSLTNSKNSLSRMYSDSDTASVESYFLESPTRSRSYSTN